MKRMKNTSTLIVMLIVLSSLILIRNVSAVTPSTPEFTLRIVEYPYDVPPTYRINEYTGEQVMTEEGYRVANRSVEIMIKNQPFTTFKDDNGNWYGFYYNVSYKPYLAEEWSYLYGDHSFEKIHSSGSEYTVFAYHFGDYPVDYRFSDSGGKIDFRVQAIIGFYKYYRDSSYFMDCYSVIFSGQTSAWSPTQTITLPKYDSDIFPTPTLPSQDQTEWSDPSPSNPGSYVLFGLSWEQAVIALLSVTVVVLLVVVALLVRKRSVNYSVSMMPKTLSVHSINWRRGYS
jgi:hypothetical protein